MSNKRRAANPDRVPSFPTRALGLIPFLLLPAGPALAGADMIGCYSLDGPAGAPYYEVVQTPGGFGGRFSLRDGSWGTIDKYEPAARGDLAMVESELADLGVNASALYGLAGEEEIIAVVSAPVRIDSRQGPSQYVLLGMMFGVEAVFKVGCSR